MQFDAALKLAQDLGFAERNPAADIEGHDACRKICILASLAFGKHVYPNFVHTEGITEITLEDVKYAEAYNCVIKLIGRVKRLERTDTLPSGCPGITGVEPESPALSAQLSLGEEKTLTTETLLTLVRTAGGYGMLAGIGSVDLSDAEAITFTYLGRFTVRLPWDSDLDYIFRSVQDLVNGLESNETGEINYMLLKSKGEMHFIPSAPGA